MMKEYYAGLDIGGTTGRLKLVTPDGQVIGEYEAEGCSINTDGAEKSRLRYREIVLPVLNRMELKTSDCKGICVTASGVDSPALEQQCRTAFEEMGFSSESLTVLNDCQVFLYLNSAPSIVVISGTGSICYGRDKNGVVCRTGGWNHILSDEGSAFDIGLKTLKTVADSLDGRKLCPILADMVIRKTKLDTLEKIDHFVNCNLFEKSRIAGLSIVTYEAAKLGDEAAAAIQQECAQDIVNLIMDTYGKLRFYENDNLQLWMWGSVLVKNEMIRNMVTEKIKRLIPEIAVNIVPISALDAALEIAAKVSIL